MSLLSNKKTDPYYNDENAIDFKWSGVKEEDEEDIAQIKIIENYKSKLMRKILLKKYLDDCLMIAVSYLMKRKIKEIFLEVFSNTKFLIKNFVQ